MESKGLELVSRGLIPSKHLEPVLLSRPRSSKEELAATATHHQHESLDSYPLFLLELLRVVLDLASEVLLEACVIGSEE